MAELYSPTPVQDPRFPAEVTLFLGMNFSDAVKDRGGKYYSLSEAELEELLNNYAPIFEIGRARNIDRF